MLAEVYTKIPIVDEGCMYNKTKAIFFFFFLFFPTITTSLPYIVIPPSSDNIISYKGPYRGSYLLKGLENYKKDILY